jgi:DNA-binding beta-propeller fold protein YncE
MHNPFKALFCLCISAFILPTTAFAESYFNFETHQFRPVAISLSGNELYVTNTPDNRLEIFDLTGTEPLLKSSVFVGLEPSAVAVRNNDEVWVVNNLSDSVSIVDVSASPPRVTRTLLVGDEPRDIVFAGENNHRAFITAAHRGQNGPYVDTDNPGELTTPGIGRSDVWVFDANNLGKSPGGNAIYVLSFFGDSPGPLAATPDGKTVYAGVFKSGNQTTIVGRVLVCPGGIDARPCETMRGGPIAPGGLPPPNANTEGAPMPEAGLIVKWDGNGWKDELDRDWSNVISLDLPDLDVFAIDASTNVPTQKAAYPGIGTILYAMAINPVTQQLYVANTDAINEVRFEGAREKGSDISTVMGHLHESRITIIDPATGVVVPVHLNNHIDYDDLVASKKTRSRSLSMPVALAVTADGKKVYVAAKGSDKIAVLDSKQLESDSFRPSTRQHIAVPGGGPAGMALDESRQRLYVLSRFDNSLVVINTRKKKVITQLAMHNPEPAEIRLGRSLFFNALETSSNGESSCASCHVAGDKDEIAWDLGDPFEPMMKNPTPVVGPLMGMKDFHPMKGPMLTQTMRGINGNGPLHWRGDRTAGNDPGGDPLDTEAAMYKFNEAFVSLMGREEELPNEQMRQLVDYSLRIMPPPNPIRALDDSLTPMQAAGENFYTTVRSVAGGVTCAYCHPVNRERGQFGTIGLTTNVIGGRPFKIPSHRNTYERAGMFGRAPSRSLPNNGQHMGPQIRGYGFTHDGGADTVIRFASYPAFRYKNPALQRRQVEQYLFAFESNFKPAVGQQITIGKGISDRAINRFNLLAHQALTGNADLVAHGTIDGLARGFLLSESGVFKADSANMPELTRQELLALARTDDNFVTFTAVPKGTGSRIALDRNEDGILDGDEPSADISE